MVGASSELLAPLVDAVRKHVLSASKLHADDTVLAPGNGKTKIGPLWTYVCDDRPSGDPTAPAVWPRPGQNLCSTTCTPGSKRHSRSSPASPPTAAAIRYALSRWRALTCYVEDGQLEFYNNAAERALRVVALGRKNFLFAGSDAGGERAAAMYSLLAQPSSTASTRTSISPRPRERRRSPHQPDR